jgi:hypothetical protein
MMRDDQYEFHVNEGSPRSPQVATPVSDIALTEDDLMNSHSSNNNVQLNRTGSRSPTSITLSLGNEASLGITAVEQYAIFRMSRRFRNLLLVNLFISVIFIPIFELPGWLFVYVS